MNETPPAPGAAGPPTAINKRLFARRRARGTAGMRPADKPMAPCLRVELVNISHGGVQLVASKESVVGQVVVLEMLPPVGLAKPQPLEAIVRWVGPDAKGGRFRVGCAWSRRLEFHLLQQFC